MGFSWLFSPDMDYFKQISADFYQFMLHLAKNTRMQFAKSEPKNVIAGF